MTPEISESEIIYKQSKPMGRPRTSKRWNPDGTLNTSYFFKEFYHKPHTCEYCGKVRKCSDNVARHQQSFRCVEARKRLGIFVEFC